ncbi:MAG: iron-only hydrogenase system regulator [Oscillospiraceae bacterium]|nr:iron-only hydrogenase system regulator [Oscillospiraceae bacterium]
MKRIAIIAIIVTDRGAAEAINALLHEYGEHIMGRMGLPCRERGVNLISVAMDAEQDVISALAGKLGRLKGVSSKTVYAPEEQ